MANACLNFTTSDYGYREGYRRAGKILAGHVVKSVGWKPESDDVEGVESYINQLHCRA